MSLIKCGNPACPNMRIRGGKTRKDGLCKHCVKKQFGRAYQAPKLEDKARQAPKESWWLGTSRVEFSKALQAQEPRFRAQGVGKDRILELD